MDNTHTSMQLHQYRMTTTHVGKGQQQHNTTHTSQPSYTYITTAFHGYCSQHSRSIGTTA